MTRQSCTPANVSATRHPPPRFTTHPSSTLHHPTPSHPTPPHPPCSTRILSYGLGEYKLGDCRHTSCMRQRQPFFVCCADTVHSLSPKSNQKLQCSRPASRNRRHAMMCTLSEPLLIDWLCFGETEGQRGKYFGKSEKLLNS